jgi:hypothetical protein
MLHCTLTSNADVDKRIISALAAFGPENIFADKCLSEELKGEVYEALILPTLLCGCEAWYLREDLFERLRSFHSRCDRSMRRVNLNHSSRHYISFIIGFFVGLAMLHACTHARMPMSRAPRQLLTG